jgi:hypothetical protein
MKIKASEEGGITKHLKLFTAIRNSYLKSSPGYEAENIVTR